MDCPTVDPPTEPSTLAGDVCGPEQFRCGGEDDTGGTGAGAECVPLAWRCDGRMDCADGSDETLHCSRHGANITCTADQFACGARGPCVAASARCDGAHDCPGAADEAACVCPPRAFRCAASRVCVRQEAFCDGDADCEDGSDEPPGCSHGTPAGEPSVEPTEPLPAPAEPPKPAVHPLCAAAGPGALYCAGRCLPRELQCDGRDHCEDGGGGGAGTDEDPLVCSSFATAFGGPDSPLAAAAACARGLWRCGSGACVPPRALCDGADDCGDYSDERACNVDECAVLNGECAHNCTDLAVGRACWCRAGWRRGPRGACRDVDECQEDDPCDHRCRHMSRGKPSDTNIMIGYVAVTYYS
ncbi:sortilin-related receptor-like [Ostrinia nubilalis]|uniref:sortilin-related receptor-like n=1 Tax=Ostrinia nubilalis TaxID=29057 RepID=UPI00308236F5